MDSFVYPKKVIMLEVFMTYVTHNKLFICNTITSAVVVATIVERIVGTGHIRVARGNQHVSVLRWTVKNRFVWRWSIALKIKNYNYNNISKDC
jgi:hypothetical protein